MPPVKETLLIAILPSFQLSWRPQGDLGKGPTCTRPYQAGVEGSVRDATKEQIEKEEDETTLPLPGRGTILHHFLTISLVFLLLLTMN